MRSAEISPPIKAGAIGKERRGGGGGGGAGEGEREGRILSI